MRNGIIALLIQRGPLPVTRMARAHRNRAHLRLQGGAARCQRN